LGNGKIPRKYKEKKKDWLIVMGVERRLGVLRRGFKKRKSGEPSPCPFEGKNFKRSICGRGKWVDSLGGSGKKEQ